MVFVTDEENCMMEFGIATLREKSGMVDGMKPQRYIFEKKL